MTGTKTEQILKYLIGVAAFFVLVPILISYQDIWDGKHVYESFFTNNKSHLKWLLLETRWTLQYYMFVGTEVLQNSLGIPYKIIFNLLACASVAGVAVETSRRLRVDLNISKEFSLVAMLTILVLPPWGTLTCSVLAFHVSCVWAFLLSLRFRNSYPVIAGILFVYSLTLNSVFAFAVGYMIFKGILTVNKDNWKSIFWHVFIFSAVLLATFILYRHFFPPYGFATGYNSFIFRPSGFLNGLSGVAAVLFLSFLVSLKEHDSEERKLLLRRVFACVVLMYFAGLAYWYVAKSVKLTGTNSFTPRQAFLIAVPTSMVIAVIAEYIKKRFGGRVTYGVVGIILLLSFSYQFAAFQQKYTQLYYENAMVEALKDVKAPLPGLVVINAERDLIPKELRDSPDAAAPIFLKVYGHRNWAIKMCTEGVNCDPIGPSVYVQNQVVNLQGFSPDDLYVTRLKFRIDNFDVFGNPLYYYYYFTNDIDRLNPRFEVEYVKKYSM